MLLISSTHRFYLGDSYKVVFPFRILGYRVIT